MNMSGPYRLKYAQITPPGLQKRVTNFLALRQQLRASNHQPACRSRSKQAWEVGEFGSIGFNENIF